MLPVKALRLELGTALAADAATLAPVANGNKIALVVNPFTPNENLVIGDFTLASFTGSTPLVAGTGTQEVGIDPTTGQQSITMKEPAGGWRFACTVTPASPQNVYGYILMDNAAATLLAMQAFDAPITISASGQFIEIPYARLTMVLEPMS
jgi:hypothetical protein